MPIRGGVVIAALAAVLGVSVRAGATDGDLYAAGTTYCASTYAPDHDKPQGFGPPLDLNAAGGDAGRPVRAPADGTVRVFSRSGIYGLSVVWRSVDGVERIHVAHLQRFLGIGEVRSGQRIGLAGSTGNTVGEGHLHVARRLGERPAPMELSGGPVRAGGCYGSQGSITLSCAGRTATIVGAARSERLVGTAGHDVIAAAGGGDAVSGRGGNDVLCGAGGSDRLAGGPGDDVLQGGPGRDGGRGDAGTDTCVVERPDGCEASPRSTAVRRPR
jgi:Peptidase family M23/RTX calcium-binding nonapeptide repeat (4 copies)